MDASFSFPPKLGTSTQNATISGFTPVDRTFPRTRQYDSVDSMTVFERQDYQQQVLYGFTTRELADLDAITDRRLQKNNLPTEIHPFFERKNWETTSHPGYNGRMQDMPPGFGGSGKWTAENDIVWDAMFPSIQIVSKLLERIHGMPWFTALLVDSVPDEEIVFREMVDLDRIRPNDKWKMQSGPDPWQVNDLLTFNCPVPVTDELREATKKKLDTIWDILENKWNVHIGIKGMTEDPWDSTRQFPDTLGVSLTQSEEAFMFLSYSLIAPLLRDDLTDCERMGLQYHLATVMFHELAHLIWQVQVTINYRKNHSMHEPYFGTDPLAECGFSAEFTAFGASPHCMLADNGEEFKSPLGYWIYTNFSCVDFVPRTIQMVLTVPQLDDMQLVFPVKASLFEDMQREEFWNVGIDIFGLEILHNRSLTEGTLIQCEGLGPDNEVDRKLLCGDNGAWQRINHPVERMRRFRERLKPLVESLVKDMNPDQRRLADFGWRMIHNSIWEEDFWRQSSDLSLYIDEMLPTLTYVFDVSDPETTSQTVARLLEFLTTTRKRHQAAVDSLLMIEHTTSTKHPPRRLQLLSWNRGARIYAMEIIDMLQSSAAVDPSETAWSDEIIGLEFARLCLYDSSVYWDVPTQLAEEETITKAYIAIEAGADDDDISHYHTASELIAPYVHDASSDTSLFTKICALVIASTLPVITPAPQHDTDSDAAEQRQSLDTSLSYAEMAVEFMEEMDAFQSRMMARAGTDLKALYAQVFAERGDEYRSWMEDARASVLRLETLIDTPESTTL